MTKEEKDGLTEAGEDEVEEADIDVSSPEEPREAGGSESISSGSKGGAGEGISEIMKGVTHIFKEGPDTPEQKNEPHTHLFVLLIIVIILGVIIAFTGI